MLRYKGTLVLSKAPRAIDAAAVLIKNGRLVAFPTETVYGLGADATNPEAVNRIFRAKGRPADNPLIVHLADPRDLDKVAIKIPETARLLAHHFWPGPLSLVLFRSVFLAEALSAGMSTVAIRVPDHETALALIKKAGTPIAAPSANRSGRPSPTNARHVLDDLAGRIDAVIQGGSSQIGLESTVVDLTGKKPVILRPGGVSREELEGVLGHSLPLAGKGTAKLHPRSPGMKYRHYAPRAPLILIRGKRRRRKALIDALAASMTRRGLNVGLLSAEMLKHSPKEQLEPGLKYFYSALRAFNQKEVDLILAEDVTAAGLGLAIKNRLAKAASRTIKV